MAELTYYYGAMGSCKSAHLLTTAFNYTERGRTPVLITARIDDRYEIGQITSRLGIHQKAYAVTDEENLFELISEEDFVDVVLVDEANFFTKTQIDQLSDVVDFLLKSGAESHYEWFHAFSYSKEFLIRSPDNEPFNNKLVNDDKTKKRILDLLAQSD